MTTTAAVETTPTTSAATARAEARDAAADAPYCLLLPAASAHAVDDAPMIVAHALAAARAGGAPRVITAVDASGPLCGAVLAAARSHLGAAAASVDIRRAGSSVMVDVTLAV